MKILKSITFLVIVLLLVIPFNLVLSVENNSEEDYEGRYGGNGFYYDFNKGTYENIPIIVDIYKDFNGKVYVQGSVLLASVTYIGDIMEVSITERKDDYKIKVKRISFNTGSVTGMYYGTLYIDDKSFKTLYGQFGSKIKDNSKMHWYRCDYTEQKVRTGFIDYQFWHYPSDTSDEDVFGDVLIRGRKKQ